MPAKHGRKAQVLLTTTPSVSMTNLVLTDSGDHTTFAVATADAAKRYWDKSAAFTFETSPDGLTWSAATPASVRYIGGQITLSTALAGATPSARVASGKYLPYAPLLGARSWAPDVSREVKEDTHMTTDTNPVIWRTFVPSLLTGSFKLSNFLQEETIDETYLELITTDTPLVVALVIDVTTGSRMECAGLITKESLNAVRDDLETEDLDFQINGPVYLIP